MSSTEEEQEELQDHKTRKRKLILLPRVQGYLDHPRLSFAVGEDGQNTLRKFRKWLGSANVKPDILEALEEFIVSVEDLFKEDEERLEAERERIRLASLQPPTGYITLSSGDSDDELPPPVAPKEELEIEWRKPRLLRREKTARATLLPQRESQRQSKSKAPSSNGRHPVSMLSPEYQVSPTLSQSPSQLSLNSPFHQLPQQSYPGQAGPSHAVYAPLVPMQNSPNHQMPFMPNHPHQQLHVQQTYPGQASPSSAIHTPPIAMQTAPTFPQSPHHQPQFNNAYQQPPVQQPYPGQSAYAPSVAMQTAPTFPQSPHQQPPFNNSYQQHFNQQPYPGQAGPPNAAYIPQNTALPPPNTFNLLVPGVQQTAALNQQQDPRFNQPMHQPGFDVPNYPNGAMVGGAGAHQNYNHQQVRSGPQCNGLRQPNPGQAKWSRDPRGNTQNGWFKPPEESGNVLHNSRNAPNNPNRPPEAGHRGVNGNGPSHRFNAPNNSNRPPAAGPRNFSGNTPNFRRNAGNGTRWSDAGARNLNGNASNPLRNEASTSGFASTYAEHKAMKKRGNSSNSQEEPNRSEASWESHSLAKKQKRIAHTPSEAASSSTSNARGEQTSGAPSNCVQNLKQPSRASPSQQKAPTTLRDRSKSIGQAPKRSSNGQQSPPRKVPVSRRKSTDHVGSRASDQRTSLPSRTQPSSSSAKVPPHRPHPSAQSSAGKSAQKETSPNKRVHENGPNVDPEECSPAKITKRRVPVETNEPETETSAVVHSAPSNSATREAAEPETQPNKAIVQPSATSAQRDPEPPLEFSLANIKQEPVELNSSQTEPDLVGLPIKMEVKEENLPASPDHTDGETDDSGADTDDEGKNVEKAIEDFGTVVDDPDFLAALSQSIIDDQPSTSAAATNGVDLSRVKNEEPPISREEEMRRDQIENSRMLKLTDINKLLATTSQSNENDRAYSWQATRESISSSDSERFVAPSRPVYFVHRVNASSANNGHTPASPVYGDNAPASPVYDDNSELSEEEDNFVVRPYNPNVSTLPPDMTDIDATDVEAE